MTGDAAASERALVHAFAAAERPLLWHRPEHLLGSVGIVSREWAAREVSDHGIEEMAQFNGSLTPEKMEALLSAAERHLLTAPLHGFGIESGAGVSVLSAVVAKRPGVRGVLAVDVCEPFARVYIPRVAAGPAIRSARDRLLRCLHAPARPHHALPR